MRRKHSILCIDIGNTNIVFGCCAGNRIRCSWRIPTSLARKPELLKSLLAEALTARRSVYGKISGSILSSVVPKASTAVSAALQELIGLRPIPATPELATGLSFDSYDTNALGVDRIADAAAAVALYGAPVMIFDFGTAATMSYIDEHQSFLGGSISPGISLSLRALQEHTASLPMVRAEQPAGPIGHDTKSCMLSGAVIGAACLVDGMYARICEQASSKTPALVLTGGLSRLVHPHCRSKLQFEPDLLLKGLHILYQNHVARLREQHRKGDASA